MYISTGFMKYFILHHVSCGIRFLCWGVKDTDWSTDNGFGCSDRVMLSHSGPPRWMYSISSAANGLLRYLAGSSWIEARVSGVPGIGVKGTCGRDNWGNAAAEGDPGVCCWRLTATVFNASWTLGFGKLCLLGNLIRGAWGLTAWTTRAAGAAILELTLLPMTTSPLYFRVDLSGLPLAGSFLLSNNNKHPVTVLSQTRCQCAVGQRLRPCYQSVL